MKMMNDLTLDDERDVIVLLIQTQKKYIKKIEVHKWVTDHYKLWKKSISMIKIDLLMLKKVWKIQETMKRCLDVMWAIVDAVAHSSFSHCSANFTQAGFSSLDESEFERVAVSNEDSDVKLMNDVEKKRKEDES